MTKTLDMSRVHEHMDGLRGLHVLYVLFAHIFFLAFFNNGSSDRYEEMPLWFLPIMGGVAVFVVISGYCLMLPVAHTNRRQLSGGIVGYLKRRFKRIVPPYYAACVLSLLQIHFFPSLYKNLGMHPDPYGKGDILSHLFLYYNLRPIWRFSINGSYWSLAPEWQLYLLFAIAFVPFWRKFGTRVTVVAAVLVTAALMMTGSAICDMHPWFLLLFVAGMAGAVATTATDPRQTAIRDRMPWGLFSCSLLALFVLEWIAVAILKPRVYAIQPVIWQQYCFIEVTMGLALLMAFLHWHTLQRTLPPHQWPWILRLLHHKRLMWLGRFSYSLYLVQWPVLVTVGSLIRSWHLGAFPTLLLFYLIGTPLTIALGYAFFLLVESRFLPTYAKASPPLDLSLSSRA